MVAYLFAFGTSNMSAARFVHQVVLVVLRVEEAEKRAMIQPYRKKGFSWDAGSV